MNRILIVHPEGNINNNPSLGEFARLFFHVGYAVDVICADRKEIYQISTRWYRFVKISNFDSFVSILKRYKNKTGSFVKNCIKKALSDYCFILGVDRDGIIAACHLSDMTAAPYALVSYEIFFADEVGEDYKKDEINACRNIRFAVCQDQIRSRHLSKENRIPLDKIINIPVSGGDRVTKKTDKRSKWAQHIPHDSRIALYMGSMSDWSSIDDLIDDVRRWPINWVLLLHNRYKDVDFHRRIKEYKDLYNKKIFLSCDPLPDIKDLYDVIGVADIGLAFYRPTYRDKYSGNNLKYIGLASGKVSLYLQCGLPVLTNKNGLLSDELEKAGVSYITDSANNIHETLSKITPEDLREKSSKACSFYDKKLNMANYATGLITALKNNERQDPCPKAAFYRFLFLAGFKFIVLSRRFVALIKSATRIAIMDGTRNRH
jgi:hypothetical protein